MGSGTGLTATIGPDRILRLGAATYRAAIGRGGISAVKREGDGATPLAPMLLRQVLYRADRVRRPRCLVPVLPLAPHDGWCDDPAHKDYNRRVRLPHEGRTEALWRTDPVYDLIGVLGWNDAPVEPGRGSGIFLHVARPDYAPTEGCIALALPDLQQALAAGLVSIAVRES